MRMIPSRMQKTKYRNTEKLFKQIKLAKMRMIVQSMQNSKYGKTLYLDSTGQDENDHIKNANTECKIQNAKYKIQKYGQLSI